MTMISDSGTFYPTPKPLIRKMCEKIDGHPENILEPSAGRGDIVEYLQENKYRNYRSKFSAIEIDSDLRATLRGKRIRVIDSDFLSFAGPDKFDLIIGNPPFETGDKHLLKAIDILYHGQIVFILNAETLRNPYTNTRKELVRKLDELGADIEYIDMAFKHAERSTEVDVALIYIKVERNVESDLFEGADDKSHEQRPRVDGSEQEVSTGKHVYELVAEYNQVIEIGTDTIVNYFRNYPKIGTYIGLNKEAKDYTYGDETLTKMMQNQLNEMIVAVRKDFWRRTLDLREVRTRMTTEKMKEFEFAIEQRCDMDFTENNIRAFVLNLISGYDQMLTDAVLSIFNKLSYEHSWDGANPNEKNVHYFNGWKTNKAFKVGMKVIIPIHKGWDGGPFVDGFSRKWKMDFGVPEETRDIDVVMNYFDGMSGYLSIAGSLQTALDMQRSKNIHSTYFNITVFKKGTMHLTFNDEDILRRFNVAACKGKNWLPPDYGVKPFKELPFEERQAAEAFEGEKSYTENLGQPIFAETPGLLKLTFSEDIQQGTI